jgi:hypothetical protein
MDGKPKINPADTYVLDEDVMDEMENFDATSVLDDTQVNMVERISADNGLLDDIESGIADVDGEFSYIK